MSTFFYQFFLKKVLTNPVLCAIIKVQRNEREVTKMYYLENGMEFATYRDAEIYCGEQDIPCEEIYKEGE